MMSTGDGRAAVDRTKVLQDKWCIIMHIQVCPMLVRMFCREGGFHDTSCFLCPSSIPAEDELAVHTWKDATIKDLSALIKEVHLESRNLDTYFCFRVINLDRQGGAVVRELGYVYNDGRRTCTKNRLLSPSLEGMADEDRTLDDGRFIQGDLIDVAIYSRP